MQSPEEEFRQQTSECEPKAAAIQTPVSLSSRNGDWALAKVSHRGFPSACLPESCALMPPEKDLLRLRLYRPDHRNQLAFRGANGEIHAALWEARAV